ncbi:MAG TPA: HupE/UreJ family protein [Kofleriaceae bacterium]
MISKRAIVTTILVLAGTASAHKPSDAHVQLAVSGERLDGSVAVALRDLDGALDLDADGNGEITWREALAAAPRIDAYARARLKIAADGTSCTFTFATGTLSDYSDGAYWSMPLHGRCAAGADSLTVTYSLLFDLDALHRGIIQTHTRRGTRTTIVRDGTPITIAIGDGGAIAAAGAGFATVWTHAATLLCLVCLVIPALVDRRARRVVPLRRAAKTAGTSVAAFILASLATELATSAGLIALPEHVVAIGVVLTVAAAGASVVRMSSARWDLAFELGLVHGIAASFALAELAPTRLATTLGFVIGVAAAELVVAALIASGLYAVRRIFTKRPVVWTWSAATVAVAIVWAWTIA